MRPKINWNSENKTEHDIFPDHYTVFNKEQDIVFTEKEAACLKHFGLGYDTKTTAKLMGISPRTIEFHVRNIKNKIELTTLSSVIVFLEEIKYSAAILVI